MLRLTLAPEDRGKHVRLMWYVLVALILSMIGRGILGFDLAQTMGYGITAYIMLIALNYRAMLAKPSKDSSPKKGR